MAREGRYHDAVQVVDLATRLDPGSSLMHRDLAWLHLALGNAGDAVEEFEEAVRRNPLDVPAHRGLAMALLASETPKAAGAAAREAVSMRLSDLRNVLLLGFVANATSDEATARDAQVEAIQQQPLLVASDNWKALGVEDPLEVLDAAGTATADGEGTTVGASIPSLRVAWLAALAGNPSLADMGLQNAGLYLPEAEMLAARARCTLDPRSLKAWNSVPRRLGWEVRLVLAALHGEADAELRRQSVFQAAYLTQRTVGAANELPIEHDGPVDLAIYRTAPLELAEPLVPLPSMESAFANWLDPTSNAGSFARGCPD
jgi:hypothetical protein